MSTSVTLYPSQDGVMYANTSIHFSNARDAASATVKNTSNDTFIVGLDHAPSGDPFGISTFFRSYLYFDTSAIPSTATITSAVLSIYVTGSIYYNFSIIMQSGQPTYPSASLALSDFNRTYYVSGGAGEASITSYSSGYQALTFNATGRSDWINKNGTSKFCLRSSLDVILTIPKTDMYASFYSVEKGGSYRPKLDIIYIMKPTVTTQAATAINTTSATGNGNITDIGDSSVMQHGVCWKAGSDPVNIGGADGYTGEGAVGTGAFTSDMSGLTASTLYYYRAYATNSIGTSYGTAQSFYTDGIPTVTTQAATSVDTTTATGNGTVVAGGGESITAHGAVYKLGGDPRTPSDPTTADGYTDEGAGSEGAFSTSITGLNHSTTYYYRAYATNSHGTGYGDAVSFVTLIPAEVPIVTTQAPTYTGGTTVTGNGNIISNGGRAITAHGVVYSKGVDPVNIATADGSTDEGAASTGSFTSDMTGLDYNCIYCIRAYSTNSAGTSYGEIKTVRMNYESVVYSSTSDGFFESNSLSSYADVLGRTEEANLYTGLDYVRIGQNHTALPAWTILRMALYFDTSLVPLGATITKAELFLDTDVYLIDRDFNIVIQDGQPTYPHASLVAGDYDRTHYSGDGGSIGAQAITGQGSGTITMNADGRAMINKGGTTKLFLRSSNDIAGSEPGSGVQEYVYIWASEKGTVYRPKLTVTYTYDKPLPQINIGGTWRFVDSMQINIGDTWKNVTEMQINIGDAWKTLTEGVDAS